MSNEIKVDFHMVQLALAQVDQIKTELYKQGIFDFHRNEKYLKAVDKYEDLYDLYEEQKGGQL
jgi:hypothetical protein